MKNIFEKIVKNFSKLDYLLLFLVVIGLVVGVTSLFRGILWKNQAQIEYLNSANGEVTDTNSLLAVDIEGAVINPGVYELKGGSRIKDVLIASGGYVNNADREYCEKNINMAQLVKDGQKIYIPPISDTPANGGYPEAKITTKTINLNTATVAELDTLWGVGTVRAETIVKNRPYNSLDEVVSKGGMTKQIFDKNVDLLVVF